RARRRDPAPVGSERGLLGRFEPVQRDPEARRRDLSAHPQHPALPACQHLGLRRWQAQRHGARDGGDRPLCARHDGANADGGQRRLRALSVPPGGAAAAVVLLRGSRRLLSRHPQGPALYSAADSRARRSAQTALYHVTHSLVRLMAPILSFTAEELWHHFAGKNDDSVFFHTLHPLPAVPHADMLLAKWQRLRTLRDPVRKEIEALRAAGQVGSSLQANVDFQAEGEDYDALASLGDELKFLLITSAARLRRGAPAVKVTPSADSKCDRCWHYRSDVDEDGLCGRCRSNLNGPGEPRQFV